MVHNLPASFEQNNIDTRECFPGAKTDSILSRSSLRLRLPVALGRKIGHEILKMGDFMTVFRDYPAKTFRDNFDLFPIAFMDSDGLVLKTKIAYPLKYLLSKESGQVGLGLTFKITRPLQMYSADDFRDTVELRNKQPEKQYESLCDLDIYGITAEDNVQKILNIIDSLIKKATVPVPKSILKSKKTKSVKAVNKQSSVVRQKVTQKAPSEKKSPKTPKKKSQTAKKK